MFNWFKIRSAVLALAVLMAVVGFSVMNQATSADAATRPAKLYIHLVATEPHTTVGQQPKIVGTYGNTGGRTIYVYDIQCQLYGQSLDLSKVIFTPQTLIPGQNANFEIDFRAARIGKTSVRCTIFGLEAGTNNLKVAYSNYAVTDVKHQ